MIMRPGGGGSTSAAPALAQGHEWFRPGLKWLPYCVDYSVGEFGIEEVGALELAAPVASSDRDPRPQAFPGSHALWAVRSGRGSNMTHVGPQNSRDLRVSWSSFI